MGPLLVIMKENLAISVNPSRLRVIPRDLKGLRRDYTLSPELSKGEDIVRHSG